MTTTTTTQSLAENEKDQKLQRRIHGAIETVQAWDADPSLLAECRALIPLDDLIKNDSEYRRDDDHHYEGDALLLKRLAVFFKEIMTWVNAPPCVECDSGDTTCERVRGPASVEEREGNASRVEVYKCVTCDKETTTFPRYNSPRKLLERQQGRCGEYANLFGLYCRALGFETRYILDVTDHVWTEVFIRGSWIMADSCEGVIGEPSMYEAGWGKKLSCNIGVSIDQVVDVTPRYTRQFSTADFQARRREVCSSEAKCRTMIELCNKTLRAGLSKGRLEELERRDKQENKLLEQYKITTKWIKGYKEGRISGSLAWRAARSELGDEEKEQTQSQGGGQETVSGFYVESFYPQQQHDTVTIEVVSRSNQTHGQIIVAGVTCAVGQPDSISIVVLDGAHVGCILQSRSFDSWLDLSSFVDTIPKDRIVALCGSMIDQVEMPKSLKRLGGFSVNDKSGTTVMFVGMVERHPSWATCAQSHADAGICVSLEIPQAKQDVGLKLEKNAWPKRVATRLPDHALPLQEQLVASLVKAKDSFLSFNQKQRYAGFVTKPNAPIYLLDETAYPFERDEESGWNTCLVLPTPLIENDPHHQADIQQEEGVDGPKFDVPVDVAFFTDLLGPSLLVHTDGNAEPTLLDTATALHNNRLVALYFSAHWCPPCKRFTPMLAEMYTHLKEEVAPVHGLEVVFVSSDRDATGFAHYYGTMPWLAVPYQQGRMMQQQISAQYGVRGIPALVVLDAISGQIVVPTAEARSDVTRACQGGDATIESLLKDNWFARIPAESQEIMQMLELSCIENVDGASSPDNDKSLENPYLVRPIDDTPPPVDPTARIKEIFDKLVVEGSAPNAAAAKAIQMFSQEQNQDSLLDKGSLQGKATVIKLEEIPRNNEDNVDEMAKRVAEWNHEGNEAVCTVLSTAQKYVANAIREPWTCKFRTFKLTNKVFDRITRVEGGLALLTSLGFSVYGSEQDFVACIPLATDLDRMESDLTRVLKEYSADRK